MQVADLSILVNWGLNRIKMNMPWNLAPGVLITFIDILGPD